MNLKKIAGSGKADAPSITTHGWNDRAFTRKEVTLIRPTLMVACGPLANRLFGMVMADEIDEVVPGDEATGCANQLRG